MYEVVEAAEAIDETGLPQQAYIPTGQPGQTRASLAHQPQKKHLS